MEATLRRGGLFSRLRPQPITGDPITVPAKVHKRALRVVEMGHITTWVDQALYLIGQNVTHHKPGDPLLEEAISAAQALLAILVEEQRMEE